MLFFWLALLFIFFNSSALAQKVIMYSADHPYGKTNSEKLITIAYGHPAFANYFDLSPLYKVFLATENGSQALSAERIEMFDPWLNKGRIAYRVRLLLDKAGDYPLCVESKNIFEPGGVVRRHFAKTVLHLERELGWERLCGFELEIKPQTRPYGLTSGVVFWGRVLYLGEPVTKGVVVTERLRAKPLENLPRFGKDEINIPAIQKTTRLKEDGSFFVSFEENGWWVITFNMKRGLITYGNSDYPFELSTHLWIYVFEMPKDTKRKKEVKRESTRKKH